jgi:hypothetical protein
MSVRDLDKLFKIAIGRAITPAGASAAAAVEVIQEVRRPPHALRVFARSATACAAVVPWMT